MFPFVNMSMLKFSSDRQLLLALMMSLPRENKRSTVALLGIAVLYLKKRSMRTFSLLKAGFARLGPTYYLFLPPRHTRLAPVLKWNQKLKLSIIASVLKWNQKLKLSIIASLEPKVSAIPMNRKIIIG